MKTGVTVLIVCLFAASVFLCSCGYLAGQVQAKNESGDLLYLAEDGSETTEPVSPSGKPREPIMEYAEDGGIVAKGAQVAKTFLPPPFGDIAAGVLGVGSAALAAWAAKKNAEARAGRKLVKNIEANKDVKAIVKANLAGKDREVDTFVKKVTA